MAETNAALVENLDPLYTPLDRFWEILKDELAQLPEEEVVYLLQRPACEWIWNTVGYYDRHCLVGHLIMYRRGKTIGWEDHLTDSLKAMITCFDAICCRSISVQRVVGRIHEFLRGLK